MRMVSRRLRALQYMPLPSEHSSMTLAVRALTVLVQQARQVDTRETALNGTAEHAAELQRLACWGRRRQDASSKRKAK